MRRRKAPSPDLSTLVGAAGRVLVRAPNPVGDLVMATGCFDAIRRACPAARITLLVKPGRVDVVDGLESFDEVLVDRSADGLRTLWRLAADLRARRFDFALLFTNSFRTALLAFLARVPLRIGYRKGGRGFLLTHAVDAAREGRRWRPLPMPELYAGLCRAAGIDVGDPRPRLAVTAECEARAEEWRQKEGIAAGEELIGLAPGASFGASKLWPAGSFAALADRLSERTGLRTLILTGPGEEKIAASIAAAMQSRPLTTIERPPGLGVLKPLIRDLRLMVTTDAGLRHYAVALGVPTVVLMGPTDPRWSAHTLEKTEVVRHDVPCGPCQLPACPLDHRCMKEITPDEVLARIDALDARLRVF